MNLNEFTIDKKLSNFSQQARIYAMLEGTPADKYIEIKELISFFDLKYPSTSHNHNLADLSERSYNSLTDKPDLDVIPLATKIYRSSTTGDTVGDRRYYFENGWEIEQICTVANATRGSGTWTYVKCEYSTVLAHNGYIEIPTAFGNNYDIEIHHERGRYSANIKSSVIHLCYVDEDFTGLTVAYTSSKIRVTNILDNSGQPTIIIYPTNFDAGGA